MTVSDLSDLANFSTTLSTRSLCAIAELLVIKAERFELVLFEYTCCLNLCAYRVGLGRFASYTKPRWTCIHIFGMYTVFTKHPFLIY